MAEQTPKPEKVKGPASYFPSIEKTYGRPIAEWKALINECPLTKHMEIVGWLRPKARAAALRLPCWATAIKAR
jgi:hypothetical protein